MFALCSKITIGGKSFVGVNDVAIRCSIFSLGSTATIKVPVTAALQQEGKPPARVEVAQEVQVGDPVQIELGYNGVYRTEFVGYVKWLNLKSPLEIECEDAFYNTRSVRITQGGNTSLGELLQACALETAYCSDRELRNFPVDDKPVSWVLDKLKREQKLCLYFDQQGKLYAGEPYQMPGDSVSYRLGENVIKDDDLKLNAEGEYRGKIETFLQPFALPGMVARIEDLRHNQRNGTYHISSTEVKFGTSGARRTVEIGEKHE